MGKKITFPTISLGSEPDNPEKSDVISFVSKHRGEEADLITCLLSASVQPQKKAGITQICSGGLFYNERFDCRFREDDDILSFLTNGEIQETIQQDARHCIHEAKRSAFALAGPSHVRAFEEISGADWADDCFSFYRSARRTMRDAGIQRHVIHDACTDSDITEGLMGSKVLLFPDCSTIPVLENLLEFQKTVTVTNEEFRLIPPLLERYEIKKIILIRPAPETISCVLEHYDPDAIVVGGYRTQDSLSAEKYWEEVIADASYSG